MHTHRDIGFRLTPQRSEILDFLKGNKGHPSAEDIYRAVHSRLPTMSLATVYATLAALKEKGKVLELTIDPDRKRYDPETESHNHMLCVLCKKIVDVASSDTPGPRAGEEKGFMIIASHTDFYGLCPDCGKERSSQEDHYVRRP